MSNLTTDYKAAMDARKKARLENAAIAIMAGDPEITATSAIKKAKVLLEKIDEDSRKGN